MCVCGGEGGGRGRTHQLTQIGETETKLTIALTAYDTWDLCLIIRIALDWRGNLQTDRNLVFPKNYSNHLHLHLRFSPWLRPPL